MTQITVRNELEQSRLNPHLYPQNLVPAIAKSCHWALETYRSRFETAKNQLCIVNEQQIDVPIRDLYWSAKGGVDTKMQHSHGGSFERMAGRRSKYRRVLETYLTAMPLHKSSLRYLYSEHSRDRLKLTHNMLTRILTYHQVMPEYLDFIFGFGSQSGPRELRFSDFCQQTMMEDSPSIPATPGQSWRQYQLCYNLKGVTLSQRNTEDIELTEWSIRQAAIHHQFDIVYGTTLWIVTKGRLDLQQRFKQLTGKDAPAENKSFGNVYECFKSSLEAHLMFCHWSTEDWRWYISWLEDVFDKETSMAIYGPQGPEAGHKQYTPQDIQDLQLWKDKTSEAAMLLESNADVMTELRSFYVGLKTNEDFTPRQECQKSIDFFAARLEKLINWMKTQVRRVNLLAHIIDDRKELILQHLQHQAMERTERLNENLERETIVMRIITIVTLIYLPATFVSTFFSTDIVKYQNDGGEPGPGTYSSVAMMRWLQVTLPLTLVTICAAWAAYKTAKKTANRSTPDTGTKRSRAYDEEQEPTKEFV